jgi:amino acid adenylation domain-containing protein
LTLVPVHPQVNKLVVDFTTLLPLEVNNSTPEPFAARAERLQSQLLADVEHRYASGVQVLRDVAREQDRSAGAAMPIVFTSLLAHSARGEQPAKMLWMGDVAFGITQTPQTWLDHQVFEEDGALGFNWDAVEDLFPEGLLQEMFDSYCGFLRRLASDAGVWQETVRPLLPAAQLEQRKAVNSTDAPVPVGLLHSLFIEQVSERPEQAAVIAANKKLTYEELYRRASHLARKLRSMGAQPNRLVAVVMDKGWEQVAAVLGVLQSGAAFLPINASLPGERLWHLLDASEVEIVLTQSWLDERLSWPLNVARIAVDTEEIAGTDAESLTDAEPFDPVQSPEDLAYVIYTSGSTGLPKGVMIDHRGAVNTIVDINERFNVGPCDKVLALSDLSFDLSIYDIFGTLGCGATIVMPDSVARREPNHWAELVEREQVTVWNSVPALLEMLVASESGERRRSLDSLRLVMLSGDWIPLTLPEQIKALAPRSSVVSLGGATEASIWSILFPINEVEAGWKSVPYGKPMVNQRFHVLNESLEPCPVWAPGGLYIAGTGLARGYWRDEQKTNASFFNHPQTGERLYKTGDLGRYLPDGNIEFLGREDSQVKIQGHRIELGEIEAALAEHRAIKAVAVKAVGKSRDKRRLVAYVAAGVELAPSAEELTEFVKAKLPSYLIPSAFVIMRALPLTSNGKVDRSALPEPEPVGREPHREAKARVTPVEQHIADAVASILEVASIDPSANLLEIGANSIDIVKIASLLEKDFGFRLKIEEFYRTPTVEGLAASYETQILQKARTGAERKVAPQDKPALNSSRVLIDPAERAAFKSRQHGLRRLEDNSLRFDLLETTPSEVLRERFLARLSHRRFVEREIPLAQFSDFLGSLRQITAYGKPKYLYASAGGLYPVQVYLHVKQGRIEGLPGGIYYYHPLHNSLALVTSNVELDRAIHEPFINRPIFDEAAFSIFLIAELSAITPLYGEYSMHFATLEAGLITQLLEMTAPANHLGICQVGGVDFGRIHHLFGLGESHVLIHSLLGGQVENSRQQAWSPLEETYYCPNKSVIASEEGEI